VLKAGDTMTGVLAVTAGTAALPGIAVSGDPNTGIYSPGADQVAISTSGVGRLFVNSSGQVGINGAPPAWASSSSISVNEAAFSPALSYVGGEGELTHNAYYDGAWKYSGTGYQASRIQLGIQGAISFLNTPTIGTAGGAITWQERLRITSAGLVGIGTTSPATVLDVASSNSGITLTNTGASNKQWRLGGNSAGSFLITETGVDDRLTIDSSGRVGIGTSSPGAPLNVRFDNAGTTTVALFENQRSVGGSPDAAQIVVGARTYNHTIIRQNSDQGTQAIGSTLDTVISNTFGSDLHIATGSPTNAARLTVTSAGLVGIGTTGPARQLDVNKTAIFDSNGDGTTTSPSLAIGSSGVGFSYIGSQQLAFITNSTEKVRLTSDGKLLVGTSSARGGFDNNSGVSSNLQVEGAGTAAGGTRTALSIVNNGSADADSAGLYLARSGGTAVGSFTAVTADDALGRITFSGADGTEFVTGASIEAAVDGTPGANDLPSRLVFSTTAAGAASPTERLRIQSDGILIKYGDTASARIQPQTDNAGFLGESTKRWEAVYAVNGTIQTSDVREKTDIVDSPLGAEFIRSLRPVAYRWKVGGYTSTYDDKGNETITPNPGVRAHYGFIAQEVKQAIGETDFGGWLQEDLSDPDSQQSLRLHEFISPIVKALQEALDEIDNLKAEVAALKAQ
jgi:hypothetical protein